MNLKPGARAVRLNDDHIPSDPRGEELSSVMDPTGGPVQLISFYWWDTRIYHCYIIFVGIKCEEEFSIYQLIYFADVLMMH